MHQRTGFVVYGQTKTHYEGRDLATGEFRTLPREIACTKAVVEAMPLQAVIEPLPDMTPGTKQLACTKFQREHRIFGVAGFGIQVNMKKASWFVNKQVRGKAKPRYITFGTVGVMSPDEALRTAKNLMNLMDQGIDPEDKKKEAKKQQEKRSVTLRIAFEAYKATRQIKLTTLERYEQQFNAIVPKWWDKPLVEIDFYLVRDTFKPRTEMVGGKRKRGASFAAQAMTVLGAVWNFAKINWPQTLHDNPFKDARKALAIKADKPRSDHVADLPKFFRAMSAAEADYKAKATARLAREPAGCNKERLQHELDCKWAIASDYVLFLLATGLRRSEAASLKWTDISDDQVITIAETKNGHAHVLPLADFHQRIIRRRREHADAINSPWVFPSPGRKNRDGHIVEANYVMEPLVKHLAAPLTVHGLRRSFGTLAYRVTNNYLLTKRLMNHVATDVTERHYLQTSLDDRRQAMEAVSEALMNAEAAVLGMKISLAG